MDYEKEYKEALERAKKWYNAPNIDKMPTYGSRIIEEIFPELKESEDEKIRKGIIRNLEYLMDRAEGFVKDELKERIAWLEKQGDANKEYWRGYREGKQEILDKYAELEKQGEQKPILDVEIPFGAKDNELQEASYHIPEGFHAEIKGNRVVIKRGEQKPLQWNISDYRTWQYIVADVLTKHDGIGQYLDNGFCKKIAKYMQEEWGEKLGKEQTQEELCKGKDYGIDGLYHAISILEKTLGKVDGYQSDDGILEHKCAIEAVNRLYKQKPAWSEEDGAMLDNIVAWFEGKWGTLGGKVGGREAYISFLKSLKDRYTWNPSDEQIKILNEVLNFTANHENPHWNDYIFGTLNNLIRQLKKLK